MRNIKFPIVTDVNIKAGELLAGKPDVRNNF